MDRLAEPGPWRALAGGRPRRSPSRPPRSRGPVVAALVASLALVAGLLTAIVLVASPVQAAGPTGCGYGSTGPQAGALCWLDMSGYNQTLADSAAGQPRVRASDPDMELPLLARTRAA
jgi:hypothetical protein